VTKALSGDTKDALAREIPGTAHCRGALRAGLAAFGAARGTVFRTRRPAIARLYRSLSPGGGAIRRAHSARLGGIATYEIDLDPEPAPAPMPAARCDRRMELRGAFLACGSLAQPAHGYHLEFIPPTPALTARLCGLLRAEGHAPRRGARKGRDVIYFKDADAIVGVLTAIGAYGAVLHLEDVRALKETKNRIHRLVNTEAANVVRAAGAAAVQREAIATLAGRGALRELSPALREIAELRLRHPSETLAELGARCRPPVGKSAANGRLASLLRLANGSARDPRR
jgi:DNA-binding transcriptional regulator WhiA